MHIAAGFAQLLRELAHQADDGIADILGVAFQLRAIEHDHRRLLRDRLSRLARNHAGFALGHRERYFRLHIGFELGLVGKHRPHGRRREHVAIEDAVEHGAGHAPVSLPVNMYGHIIDMYKFVKRRYCPSKSCWSRF
jgi:hypothetical protein